jgi:hypothetical protein
MKKIPQDKIVKGLKFLTHGCSTIREDVEYSYATAINQWMTHPAPAKWDGNDCGAAAGMSWRNCHLHTHPLTG